jgi:hypothetical protein
MQEMLAFTVACAVLAGDVCLFNCLLEAGAAGDRPLPLGEPSGDGMAGNQLGCFSGDGMAGNQLGCFSLLPVWACA